MKTTRTYKLLLKTAIELMDAGLFPSITEIAEKTRVSRATAYRYFPSQAALVSAVVEAVLDSILTWNSTSESTLDRVDELFEFAYPKMLQHEGALRAAIKVSLELWAEERVHTSKEHQLMTERLVRGNRKQILKIVTAPLENKVSKEKLLLAQQALSLIFGSEVLLVFKDIWQLDNQAVQDITKWMGKAIIKQILAESTEV